MLLEKHLLYEDVRPILDVKFFWIFFPRTWFITHPVKIAETLGGKMRYKIDNPFYLQNKRGFYLASFLSGVSIGFGSSVGVSLASLSASLTGLSTSLMKSEMEAETELFIP